MSDGNGETLTTIEDPAERKFRVFAARMAYGGRDGTDVSDWIAQSMLEAFRDKDLRVENFFTKGYNGTPTTRIRNQIVKQARQWGADLLFMVDDDVKPDMLVGKDPNAKPVFAEFMRYAARHYPKGPFCIGAPYCGCGRDHTAFMENVFCFKWEDYETDGQESPLPARITQFTREEAARRAGIERVPALPTGLILYDMRCFGEPVPEMGTGAYVAYCEAWKDKPWRPLPPPWFYYQYTDVYQTEVASTEDVTNTRDLEFLGIPAYVHWDCWLGHYRLKCVTKPMPPTPEVIGERLRAAVLSMKFGEVLRMDDGPHEDDDDEPISGWTPAAAQGAQDARQRAILEATRHER